MGWKDAPEVSSSWKDAPLAEESTYKPGMADFVAANVDKGLTGAIGGMVDVPINIGKVAYGMGRQLVGTKLLGESPSEAASHAPDISWPVSNALFSAGRTPQEVQEAETAAQPTSNAGRYAQRAIQFASGAALGKPSIGNIALGGVSGLTSQAAQDIFPNSNAAPVVGALIPQAVSLTASSLANRPLNPVQQKTLENAQKANEAGLVIPPAEVKPTLVNKFLGSVAGKDALKFEASRKNAPVLNQQIIDEINSSADKIGAPNIEETATPEAFNKIRQKAGESYDALKKFGTFKPDGEFRDDLTKLSGEAGLSGQNSEVNDLVNNLNKSELGSGAVVTELKRLRFHAGKNLGSQDPMKVELGRAQLGAAGSLESLVERNLKEAGNSSLLDNFQNARELIAKTYSAEKALNPSSGNFDTATLGNQLKKGKPLSGGLKDAAEFSNSFPSSVKLPEKIGAPVSKVDAMLAGLLGFTGGPAMGAAPLFASPAARMFLLSKPYQRSLFQTPGSSSVNLQNIAPLLSVEAEQTSENRKPLINLLRPQSQ